MFEQYIKLFRLDWIEPWMVEALAIIGAALVLGLVVAKSMDCLHGEDR